MVDFLIISFLIFKVRFIIYIIIKSFWELAQQLNSLRKECGVCNVDREVCDHLCWYAKSIIPNTVVMILW